MLKDNTEMLQDVFKSVGAPHICGWMTADAGEGDCTVELLGLVVPTLPSICATGWRRHPTVATCGGAQLASHTPEQPICRVYEEPFPTVLRSAQTIPDSA